MQNLGKIETHTLGIPQRRVQCDQNPSRCPQWLKKYCRILNSPPSKFKPISPAQKRASISVRVG